MSFQLLKIDYVQIIDHTIIGISDVLYAYFISYYKYWIFNHLAFILNVTEHANVENDHYICNIAQWFQITKIVTSVVKDLLGMVVWVYIKGYTLERNLIIAIIVANDFPRKVVFKHTKEDMQERNHICAISVIKAFSQNVHLLTYFRIHTGEKPHQCSYCDMDFKRKWALSMHLKTHIGGKPHQCSCCDNALTWFKVIL